MSFTLKGSVMEQEMKVYGVKKINSIDYGWKVVLAGVIFTVVLPVVLWLFMNEERRRLLQISAVVSFVAGLCILISFGILLLVELRQDKYLFRYYENHKNVKLKYKDGFYECQACGNKMVREDEKNCRVCGIKFVDADEKKTAGM